MVGFRLRLRCRWSVGALWILVHPGLVLADPDSDPDAVPTIEATVDPIEEVRAEDLAALESRARALLEERVAELEGRKVIATGRQERADRYFSGELALEGAFSDLADRPLDDPAFLRGAQLELESRIADRAVERVRPPPEHLTPEEIERLKISIDEALSAEDQADLLQQRLLGGMQGGLARAPEFRESRIREALERYGTAREAIGQPTADDPDAVEKAQIIASWAEAEALTQAYRRAARHSMTVGESTRLDALVAADLARALTILNSSEDGSSDGLSFDIPEDYGCFDRLGWVSGLVIAGSEAQIAEIQNRILALEEKKRLKGLAGELAEAEARLAAIDEEVVAESVEQAELELEAAQREREELESRKSEALDAELELLIQIASTEEQIAQARIDIVEDAQQVILEESATNQQELAEAQARAEEARLRAEEAHEEDDPATSALRDQVLVFSNQAAQILLSEVGTDEAPGRSPLARQRVADLQASLESAQMAASAALGMAPLEPGRQEAIDDAWTELREVVEAVRTEVWSLHLERDRILTDLKAARNALPDAFGVGNGNHEDLLVQEWHDSLGALNEVMEKQEQNLTIELDAGLELLSSAKAERRQLRSKVSTSRLSEIQQTFLRELVAEFREFPLQLISDVRSWSQVMSNLGAWMMDLSLVASAFWGLVEFFIILGIWLFLRHPLAVFLQSFADGLQERRVKPEVEQGRVLIFLDRYLEHGNYAVAGPRLAELAVDLFSVLTAGLCLAVLGERLSLLVLFFMIWQVRNCVRAGPRLVALFFAGPGQLWPTWRRVTEAQRALIHYTAWILCLWASLEWFLHGIALGIMDADRLNDVVDILAFLVGLVIVFRLLKRWAEHIRKEIEKRGNDRFTPMMANAWALRVLHPIQALAGLIYLIILFVLRMGVQLLSSRRGLNWLTAMFMRQQLKERKEVLEPLPLSQREALGAGAPSQLSLEAEAAEIQSEYLSWRESRRRGMIALIGDRGSGKSRMMDRLEVCLAEVELDEEKLSVRRIQCPRRHINEEEALNWLAQEFELSLDVVHKDALIEACSQLPAQVLAVDDLHQVFRRAVGGFDGLVCLLDVMHATSEEHFWLVSIHEPAWTFLRGIPGVVNLSVFRDSVAIHRLAAQEARDWLESRAEAQGLALDYGGLVGETLPGVDRDRAQSRSRDAFWRFLVQSSQGNPRIVLMYWLRSLRSHDDPDCAEISLFDAPDHTDLQKVGDREFFVLTALVIHNGLHVEDISAVLNLPVGDCRSVCRQLESQGILRGDDRGSRFNVELAWLPAVERILQLKHFLYGKS